MFQFNLSKTLKPNQNQLFGETHWRLATWYAGIMVAILILCGLGVYQALIYAHRLTIIQELESVANHFHEILEPILEQPEKLTPAATAILPNLCVIETECDKFLGEETEHSILQPPKYYYVRLLDLTGNLIALGGRQPEGMIVDGTKEYWDGSHHNYYQQVSLMLHTQDFQNWGYIEVGRNFPEYKLYLIRLQLIFLVGLLIVMLVLIIISWWLAAKAIKPIHQSYQLLQQFTADAAHELRTPLATIRATVESSLMVSELTEIQARETLKIIGRQNMRLSNLVADLLMLCRIDRQLSLAHSAGVTQEKISLFDLIHDIAEDFASLSIKSQIKLLTEIWVDEPLVIIGNYEQLYRMVSNLVANGLKYNNPGGEVRLILGRRVKYALIQVQDTGIGISEINKVFERFYREKSDRSRHTGGSGLGLSIAQAIAKSHQGTIQVASKLGQGSTFTISLPIIEIKSS